MRKTVTCGGYTTKQTETLKMLAKVVLTFFQKHHNHIG